MRRLWLILLVFSLAASAQIDPRRDLFGEDLPGWKEKRFSGHTRYQLVQEGGRNAVLAVSDGTASALYLPLKVDLRETPILRWQWKVANVHRGADPFSKAGDDYAARVYVIVREGFLPWQTRALNYVWANAPTAKSFWHNPFTERAAMIPVAAGGDGLGQWQQQRVDVRADFKRVFGLDIDSIDGIALMTDADNTGGTARAWYRDLYFSER